MDLLIDTLLRELADLAEAEESGALTREEARARLMGLQERAQRAADEDLLFTPAPDAGGRIDDVDHLC